MDLGVRQANWLYTSGTFRVGLSLIRPFIHTYLNMDGTLFTDRPGNQTMTFKRHPQSIKCLRPCWGCLYITRGAAGL
jgi:hypothetical protein